MHDIQGQVDRERAAFNAAAARMESANGRAQAIVARAEAAGREVTADEQRQLDRLNETFDVAHDEAREIKDRIDALEATPMPRKTERSAIVMSRGAGRSAPRIGMAREDGGFEDFGDFARAVAVRDPRLFHIENASGMQTHVGADGGFAIPPSFSQALMQQSLEQEVVRPRAMRIPMPTGKMDLPRFDDSDRSTGHAGMTGKHTGEGATAATQKAKLESLMLSAHKFTVLVPTTLELLEDGGPVFGQLLADHMSRAMAAKVDDMLLLGSGAAEPLGLVNAPCTVEVDKESGQAAASLVPPNLSKMVARLAPGAFGRSVWLAHSSVVAELFLLTQKVAHRADSDDVGGFQPGWFSTSSDGSMQLMSRPLIVTDRLQPLGTAGDIVLVDLSDYMVGEVGDLRLAVDTSLGFKESEIWYRAIVRIDGQPKRKSAITPRNGSDTLSPFVRLATRA